ncbi:Fc.00g005520.m01.CDS01 [Cosmosporella sp. VM-42]
MARQRKEKSIKNIKLKQPDRSGPSEKTLFELAEERELMLKAEMREKELKSQRQRQGQNEEEESEDEGPILSPRAERFLEAMLWTSTLAMMHFTFDVLVQNQYGTSIKWNKIWWRAGQAWMMFLILFYPLHPHKANPILVPGVPKKYQHPIRQTIFFAMSVISGCYLIYITNTFGYLAIMKRAPPLGCLWIWAVVEMDLLWACLSLFVAGGFLYQGGYDIK